MHTKSTKDVLLMLPRVQLYTIIRMYNMYLNTILKELYFLIQVNFHEIKYN